MTKIHRRSLLAAITSLAAALTVTRRGYGAETVDAEEGTRRSVRPSGETTMRPFGDRMPTTIDLKTLGPEHRVASISSSNNTHRVTTVSGRTVSFSEFDLRFKTDSSVRGPEKGHPVLLPSSKRTDRAFVVFAHPRETSAFIGHEAQQQTQSSQS